MVGYTCDTQLVPADAPTWQIEEAITVEYLQRSVKVDSCTSSDQYHGNELTKKLIDPQHEGNPPSPQQLAAFTWSNFVLEDSEASLQPRQQHRGSERVQSETTSCPCPYRGAVQQLKHNLTDRAVGKLQL